MEKRKGPETTLVELLGGSDFVLVVEGPRTVSNADHALKRRVDTRLTQDSFRNNLTSRMLDEQANNGTDKALIDVGLENDVRLEDDVGLVRRVLRNANCTAAFGRRLALVGEACRTPAEMSASMLESVGFAQGSNIVVGRMPRVPVLVLFRSLEEWRSPVHDLHNKLLSPQDPLHCMILSTTRPSPQDDWHKTVPPRPSLKSLCQDSPPQDPPQAHWHKTIRCKFLSQDPPPQGSPLQGSSPQDFHHKTLPPNLQLNTHMAPAKEMTQIAPVRNWALAYCWQTRTGVKPQAIALCRSGTGVLWQPGGPVPHMEAVIAPVGTGKRSPFGLRMLHMLCVWVKSYPNLNFKVDIYPRLVNARRARLAKGKRLGPVDNAVFADPRIATRAGLKPQDITSAALDWELFLVLVPAPILPHAKEKGPGGIDEFKKQLAIAL
ncbi:hypothetical protein QBC33DRAFT_513137 [Phialemonium atrogriseum]|uniref:Uncharacterized protein n=1 Tax=Phialemonium atrogriseum TaxID=1093897 RepID=A0AAJ0FNV7_9PEZI|nr:uncharacterized protein QBC33DRAFT_513137 [Phialemonium atrogriseum]KAK1769648.1 hypothetical protein QBC33DRAFT_513137 [Phialemonium atrogriseum]